MLSNVNSVKGPVRCAVIGIGTMGKRYAEMIGHGEIDGLTLAAVCCRSDANAAWARDNLPGSVKICRSEDALYEHPDLFDAAIIVTPNNMHYENALLCLNAGKNVLCEKPFTTNAADAVNLYRIAEEKGLFIMEAFWIRFLPLYEKLLEVIRSGEYGQLRHARCDYGFIAKGARRDRKFKSELGGGALLDIGIYNLGFLRMIMGADPESFTSEVHFNEFGTDDFSVIQLSYPGGRTAHSLQAIGMQIDRQAALYLDRASIYLPDFQGAYSMTIRPVDGDPVTIECPPDVNGFEYEIREASRCVREGRSHSDIFLPEDSVAVLKLLDEVRDSWNMRFAFE